MFPYFDALFDHLKEEDRPTQEAFGEFVHWGYWDDEDKKTDISPSEFHQAAVVMLSRMLKGAAIKPGSRVLDVGSGMGGTINYLNKNYSNCELVGVNIDERQIAYSTKRLTAANGNTIEFVKSDACSMPFEDKNFDVILCVESIFHFGSRKAFFKECGRLLKPGGQLIISDFVPVHAFSSFMNFAQRKFHLMINAYGVVDINASIPKYSSIAEANGLSLDFVDDITKNTLPTYTFLRNNFSLATQKGQFKFATTIIEYVSKIGMLQYLILGFKK